MSCAAAKKKGLITLYIRKYTPEVYSEIAEEVCLDYTEALRAIAVKDEPSPAKLKWNC